MLRGNFGVPNLGLIAASIVPALMVVAIRDVAALGDLYAVGVVGAIATNLGETSTDTKLGLLLSSANGWTTMRLVAFSNMQERRGVTIPFCPVIQLATLQP